MSKEETIPVPVEAYKEMSRDALFLTILELHGVDKWEGFAAAKEAMDALGNELTGELEDEN